MQEPGPGPSEMVGAPDTPSAGMLSLFGKSTGDGTRADVFAVGDRANILLHLDAAALIPHVAEAERRKFPAEVLFRSVNKLLMDTATSEYLFCADFFGEDAMFHELFAPTLQAVESHLSSTVSVPPILHPTPKGLLPSTALALNLMLFNSNAELL